MQWKEALIDAALEGKRFTRLSDFRIRDKVIPAMVSDIEARQAVEIRKHNNWTLNLDGWTCCSGLSHYATMIGDKVSQMYLDNLELDLKRHTAAELLRSLKIVIAPFISNIRAIVTDSPNVMIRLRADLHAEYHHIIPIRCPLHALNLLCRDLVKYPEIADTVTKISKLVVFFFQL